MSSEDYDLYTAQNGFSIYLSFPTTNGYCICLQLYKKGCLASYGRVYRAFWCGRFGGFLLRAFLKMYFSMDYGSTGVWWTN